MRYRAGDAAAELSMDIAAAYPAGANVKSWRRTHRLNRGGGGGGGGGEFSSVEILDDYVLDGPGKQIALSLMSACAVTVAAPGRLTLAGDGGKPRAVIEYDAARLTPEVEAVPTADDARLRPVWGERVYRIRLRQDNPPQAGQYRVRVTP